MNLSFEERIAQKQAAREMRARLSWEEKVSLIERMKEQLASWKKPLMSRPPLLNRSTSAT